MDKAKIIKEVTEKLLAMLGIEVQAHVEMLDDHASVTLSTDDTGILIGYHGETLEALQLVTALCVSKEAGEFIRLSFEIGDYRKTREDLLRQMVAETKEKVKNEGRAISLPQLKSWERRFVHMILTDDSEVVSESVGEGRERTLEIRPKN